MAQIEAERKRLTALSDAALLAIKAESDAEEEAKRNAEMARWDAVFESPDMAADFDFWTKAEYWTFDEAVALLLGKQPEKLPLLLHAAAMKGTPFAKRYGRLHELAKRAGVMTNGQRLSPAAVVRWATSVCAVEVPEVLLSAFDQQSPTSPAVPAVVDRQVGPENRPPLNRQLARPVRIDLHAHLAPKSPWKGGYLASTDKVTLEEAARFASRQAGEEVRVEDFLRAAARGQIPLRAVVHTTARTKPCVDGDEPWNQGNPVPRHSIPTLPIEACMALANVGHASWRTFEFLTSVNGFWHRVTRWELAPGEPDFETTLADCRLMGADVHALADEFSGRAETEVAVAASPIEPPSHEHKVKTRSDPLGAVIEKAKEMAIDRNDYQSVWASLVTLAKAADRPSPLLGYADSEGVKYEIAERDEPKFFTKNALRKRMNPDARGR